MNIVKTKTEHTKDVIDWERFDSLSESEQLQEKKTWSEQQVIQYFKRDGTMTMEEVRKDLHDFIDSLEDKSAEIKE